MATIRRWLRALRPGWKLEASSTAPTWRTGSASARYGLPSILALPAVGVTSPSSIRRVVVLPAPLGPRNPTTVPWSTSKLRSSTATTSPKRLVSPSMVMTAMVSSSAPVGLLVEADHVEGAEQARRYEAGLLPSSAPSRQLRVGRQVYDGYPGQLGAGRNRRAWPDSGSRERRRPPAGSRAGGAALRSTCRRPSPGSAPRRQAGVARPGVAGPGGGAARRRLGRPPPPRRARCRPGR